MKNYGAKEDPRDVATMSDVGGACKVQELAANGNIEADADIVIYAGTSAGLLTLPRTAANGHSILVKNLGSNTSLNVVDTNSRIVNYNTEAKVNSVLIAKRATIFRFVRTTSSGDVWLVESYY